MRERERHRGPLCPYKCGKRLRVKPKQRTVPVPRWHCLECKKMRPEAECEWTNAELMLATEDSESAS